MEKVTIFIALGFVAVVFGNPMGKTQLVQPISGEQIQAFREELQNDTSAGNITCENYHELCNKVNGKEDPNSVCRITLNGFLCDKLQDDAGILKIIARIQQVHPEAINPTAGQGVGGEQHDEELEEDDDYGDDDEDEYDDDEDEDGDEGEDGDDGTDSKEGSGGEDLSDEEGSDYGDEDDDEGDDKEDAEVGNKDKAE